MLDIKPMENRIAAIVVVYFPNKESLLLNIHSYAKQAASIYIIDNTPTPSLTDLDLHAQQYTAKICYLPQYKNMGVATALNIGCRAAMEDGFKWTFTMDQDSSFLNTILVNYFNNTDLINIGIIAPVYTSLNITFSNNETVKELDHVITSGNLLNLQAWKEIAGFDDKLFIDEVDTDFCFRLRLKKYKIKLVNEAKLQHELGNQKRVFYLFKYRTLELHRDTRIYYLFRNTYYLKTTYQKQFPVIVKARWLHLFSRLKHHLFTSSRWYRYLYYAVLGIIHAKQNKFGALD